MSDPRVDLAVLHERIGQVQAKADAAHTRMDILQSDIKSELKGISEDVKLLLANYHTQRGSKAMLVTVITLGIALLGALAKILIH